MAERKMEAEPELHSIGAMEYRRRRKRLPSSVDRVSLQTYLRVLTEFSEGKRDKWVDQVLSDILEIYTGNSKAKIILSVLKTQTFYSFIGKRVVSMLKVLEASPEGLEALKKGDIEVVVRKICEQLPPSDADAEITALVCPILSARLQQYKPPSGIDSLTYNPPPVMTVAFTYVDKLVSMGLHEQAVDAFQPLVDLGFIPVESVQRASTSSEDFKMIISMTLIRAGIYWKQHTLAMGILEGLLSTHGSPDVPSHQAVVDGTIDVLYSCLESPTPSELIGCGRLIREVHYHSPVPDSVIRQFYNSASDQRFGEAARDLYTFTQRPDILEQHRYPPPQGAAVLFLMQTLTKGSGAVQFARALATEAADGNVLLPVYERARFIAIAASSGFAKPARILWTRYSAGKDRLVVLGNAALMIRMVSLFTRLAQDTDAKVQERVASGEEQSDDASLRESAKDFAQFADHVLAEYTRIHEPLNAAPHLHLTSIARAHFILGNGADGLKMFKILMDRREIPDLVDINVAMTYLAEHSPRSAAKMIERMIESGLHPDAITFGTVIHHAIVHDDVELVTEMLKQARSLPNTELTFKSVNALIRAAVLSVDGVTLVDQKERLRGALNIIKSLLDAKFVSTPHTGKYMVYASLRLQEPRIAYEFWKLLLKDTTEWDDHEQIYIRQLICRMVCTEMDPESGRDILHELQPTKDAGMGRRRNVIGSPRRPT